MVDGFYGSATIHLRLTPTPMELTKEYFDEQLKKLATKEDLKSQTKEFEDYTDQVAATILESVYAGFQRVHRRLDSRDKRIEHVESDLKEMKEALNLS